MRTHRKLNRRSFLATVAGSAAMGSLLIVSDEARAQTTGCSDNDSSDHSNNGQHCTPGNGCSDTDPGDARGAGRNCVNTPGTRTSGCSDTDSGPESDSRDNGRHCRQTNCTDRDSSDPTGSGRNCGTFVRPNR